MFICDAGNLTGDVFVGYEISVLYLPFEVIPTTFNEVAKFYFIRIHILLVIASGLASKQLLHVIVILS